jgi:hypothetical protein
MEKRTLTQKRAEPMKHISQIAHETLMKISSGSYTSLPQLGITGLLNDLKYVWNKQLQIPNYNFEMLDIARLFCNSENQAVFKMTNCKSVGNVRDKFQEYLLENYMDDDRVIISIIFERPRINAEWLPLDEYLASANGNESK